MPRMRREFILGFVLGLLFVGGLGVVWNAAWEARPAGTDLASDLDLFINELKTEIRQRAEVEHLFGSSTDDNGLHAMGSARAFVQNVAPLNINGGVAALGQYNSAAGADAGTSLATDEIGSVTRDLGAGRLWVDLDGPNNGTAATSDNNTLGVWNEALDGFQDVVAEDAGAGKTNLVYNGSFEITDGTGATGAVDVVPAGWTELGTPTEFYVDPPLVSEGEGIALRLTATGAANEGVSQSLSGLKANFDYVVRARVRPVVGTCDLQVTGGDFTQTDTSDTATGVFETLEVLVNTTGAPAPLVVRLEANLDTNQCDFDHVVAFERDPVVPQPGSQFCRATDSSLGAAYYTDAAWAAVGVTCSVTVPGPGYAIRVTGQVQADSDAGVADGGLLVRLRESVNGGAASTVSTGSTSFRILTVGAAWVGFLRTPDTATPGSLFTYTMDGRTTAAGMTLDRNIDDAIETQGETPVSWIQVELVPTR